ncbi:hypothetical protein [Thermomonas mangrovi]|uniref:hypothetical protein n=1 Tax=Thermomonas mangrovi TaxID=2993316 RepID=UPI002308218A|nr:hypothetical protein [Thermomonas mangrovi]
MSKAEDIFQRRKQLVGCIAASSRPLTTHEVRVMANLTSVDVRTIQRDLEKLVDEDRVSWDKEKKGWTSGEKRIEEELDRVLSFTALRIFNQLFDNLLPGSLQKSLKRVMGNYKKQLQRRLDRGIPEVRWLNALVLGHGYHWFERPVLDPDVREIVEAAILNGHRIRVRMKHLPHGVWWHTDPDEMVEVSIRNFVLDLPDRPSIIIERHDLEPDEFGEPAIRDIRSIWPLELIEDAEALTAPAKLLPAKSMVTLASEPVYREYVLAIDPLLVEEFTGTWLVRYLTDASHGGELLGINAEDGWGIYRMRCPEGAVTEWQRHEQSLRSFVSKWMEYVEVIEPHDMRMQLRQVARGIVDRYQDPRPLPKDVLDRLIPDDDQLLDDGIDHTAIRWWFDPVKNKIIQPYGTGKEEEK